MLSTPILFLVFNRPDTTQRVFDAIRQAKPRHLFIAADGPRTHKPDDAEKCQQVREIISQVDWDCEVKTLFRNENMGCKYAVSSAIDWFFENVEEGIILEDDTLPDSSFFSYCTELLAKYRDFERIMHISGCNWNPDTEILNESYFFSKYPNIWGWATWRRAWQSYDVKMSQWPACRKQLLSGDIFSSWTEYLCWKGFFNAMQIEKVDTWDTQWILNVWVNNGVCITPKTTLVNNLGIGVEGATHTTGGNEILNSLHTKPLVFPLIYPTHKNINKQHDLYLFEYFYYRWRKHFSMKQYLHDKIYIHMPKNVKYLYQRMKSQIVVNA